MTAEEKCNSFSIQDLFDAFKYYAFTSISNQPYNKAELKEHFDKWFKSRFEFYPLYKLNI